MNSTLTNIATFFQHISTLNQRWVFAGLKLVFPNDSFFTAKSLSGLFSSSLLRLFKSVKVLMTDAPCRSMLTSIFHFHQFIWYQQPNIYSVYFSLHCMYKREFRQWVNLIELLFKAVSANLKLPWNTYHLLSLLWQISKMKAESLTTYSDVRQIVDTPNRTDKVRKAPYFYGV